MFGINLKRPLLTLTVTAGLLAIAGPASVDTAVGNPESLPGSQAHWLAPPTPSSGGHPSQGAPTVGGGITSKPERYRSPTPALADENR
jgi:hypothetical protein